MTKREKRPMRILKKFKLRKEGLAQAGQISLSNRSMRIRGSCLKSFWRSRERSERIGIRSFRPLVLRFLGRELWEGTSTKISD